MQRFMLMKGNGMMPGKISIYYEFMSDFDVNISIKFILNDRLSEYQ